VEHEAQGVGIERDDGWGGSLIGPRLELEDGVGWCRIRGL
jgi:hypothetical protein